MEGRVVKQGDAVRKLYPNETWTSESNGRSSLYIASARKEDGGKDPKVYDSDKMMANTLAIETGKDVFMLPERNDGGKNPDCFFDGKTIEMKHVESARPRKVGTNALRALEQSENAFIYIDNSFSIGTCLEKIKGALIDGRQNQKKDKPFVEPNPDALLFIFVQGKLHKHTWADVL